MRVGGPPCSLSAADRQTDRRSGLGRRPRAHPIKHGRPGRQSALETRAGAASDVTRGMGDDATTERRERIAEKKLERCMTNAALVVSGECVVSGASRRFGKHDFRTGRINLS